MSTLLMPEEREQKLPRWAQDRLTFLRGAIRNQQETLDALGGEERTHVSALIYTAGSDSHTVYLPNNARLRMEIGAWGSVQFYRNYEGARVSTVHGRLVVEPVAANCVNVKTR